MVGRASDGTFYEEGSRENGVERKEGVSDRVGGKGQGVTCLHTCSCPAVLFMCCVRLKYTMIMSNLSNLYLISTLHLTSIPHSPLSHAHTTHCLPIVHLLILPAYYFRTVIFVASPL